MTKHVFFELALREFLLLEKRSHWYYILFATLEELIFRSPTSSFPHCLVENTRARMIAKSVAVGTCSYVSKKLQEVQGIVILGSNACSYAPTT